ncbi:hypothetical protein [Halobacillus litoralis]|uniref:hypothetical protein n=1 Tax=Halobacillus litoralis TaxID=45668 RepID=UPI001CFF1327|nr:hypothetical protein [Halobacillus litoralis]
MSILLETLDGSYDLLFLSIYISLLVSVALETIWRHMVTDTSKWMGSHQMVSNHNHLEITPLGHLVEFINEVIHWLQRTVRRKDSSDDGDHLLFIRF